MAKEVKIGGVARCDVNTMRPLVVGQYCALFKFRVRERKNDPECHRHPICLDKFGNQMILTGKVE